LRECGGTSTSNFWDDLKKTNALLNVSPNAENIMMIYFRKRITKFAKYEILDERLIVTTPSIPEL